MISKKYATQEEILLKAEASIGIPLKYIDKTGRLKTGKGAIGTVMEESWFGYRPNNNSEPDFSKAGVELKTFPYVRTRKNTIVAKERLVCNIINYMEEYKQTFKSSSFWHKCKTILLMPYEYKTNVSKGDFMIDKAILFRFSHEDLLIIERDWETIINKIRTGKAHEISEGDTLYLGACTKGANSKILKPQPFSNIKAKPRAYSLKQSYMTYVLNNYIFGKPQNEKIINDSYELIDNSFESYILKKVQPYLGRTQLSLLKEFQLKPNVKNVNELILSRILGLNGKISKSEEFQKANIIPKTVRINVNGSITESMSFPAFDFKKLASEDWDTSEFKTMLEQTKFLFVIFRFQKDGSLVFDDLVFWNIPDEDIDEVQNVWKRTVKILNEGVELNTVNGRTFNNLPKASESSIAHVRPHGRDSNDTLELPDGRKMPKQCFWLKNTYIRRQIEKLRGQ